jgi:3-hydroxyacyl-CoA dehydrogenase
MGYLRDSDIIIMNSRELLYIAKEQVKLMSAANYKPPFKAAIPAAGTSAKATIEMLLANMKAGQFISKYDYEISEKIAGIMTGGGVDTGTQLPEEWYLNLEVNAFVSLADNQETQDRIQYMLTNGKPLRN